MSLILDALKKAEQDRHAGQPPALDEMIARPRPAVSARRRNAQKDLIPLAAIALGLLFALAGLAYWLWPKPAPTTAPPPAAASQPASGPVQAITDDTLQIDPERLRSPQIAAMERGVDVRDTGAAEAATMDELDGEQPVTTQPLTPQEPEESLDDAPAQPVIATAPPPEPAPVVREPAARPLKEMPPAYRSEFPKLTLDVHVFDPNPLRRFALINGKKYRETDTLLDGPRVIEITPQGVVVEHRGSKVLIELPR